MQIPFDELTAYVYGLGRGFGIQVTPRHHQGGLADQIRSLAADVVAAEQRPMNSDLGAEVTDAFQSLQDAIAQSLPPTEIERHIRNYIQARRRILGEGSVE
jgi:hypothetical protein